MYFKITNWVRNIGILFSFNFLICKPQELRVEYSSVKLLEGGAGHSLYYDGDDSIYILGGDCTESMLSRYSLEEETISRAGTIPWMLYGSIETDNKGNVFLFHSRTIAVHKLDMSTNTTSLVATLPWELSDIIITVKPCRFSQPSDTVLLLGGEANQPKVWSFNMTSYDLKELATLTTIPNFSSSICLGSRALIFPNVYFTSFFNGSVWELDLDTLEMSSLVDTVLPIHSSSLTPVTDGSYVYIIAGFQENSQFPNNKGLLRFDLNSNSTTFLPVANWPDQEESFFDKSPQCIYVPKMNRIYCFGGYTESGYRYHDEIFYIDMSSQITNTPTSNPYTETRMTTPVLSTTTMNPDFFTCNNRSNGFYPNPIDCSLFIGCRNEELDHFSCSPPLLFNPLTSICDLPHNVVCETSCINKENGYYPHPHDCSLYIICDGGEATLVKCPPPLLFDPILILCNYPENVNCSI